MRDGEGALGAGGDRVNPRISRASARDSVRPKHLGNHAGSGGVQGRAGSGSPVSCRKSTSVIPQVSTVCPVRTRTPGLRSAQGAIASARGPTRKKRSEGRALRGRGPAATRGLEDAGCGRGLIGSGRLPIGRQLRPSRPSSPQVPEEAEGGAGARAAGNSPNPTPNQPGNFRKPGSRRESRPSPTGVPPPAPGPQPHACVQLPGRFKDPGVVTSGCRIVRCSEM